MERGWWGELWEWGSDGGSQQKRKKKGGRGWEEREGEGEGELGEGKVKEKVEEGVLFCVCLFCGQFRY